LHAERNPIAGFVRNCPRILTDAAVSCVYVSQGDVQHQRKYRGQKGAVEACKNCAKSIQTRQGARRPRSLLQTKRLDPTNRTIRAALIHGCLDNPCNFGHVAYWMTSRHVIPWGSRGLLWQCGTIRVSKLLQNDDRGFPESV